MRYETLQKQSTQMKDKVTELQNTVDKKSKQNDSFSMRLAQQESLADYLQQQLDLREKELKSVKEKHTSQVRGKQSFSEHTKHIQLLEQRNAELVDR